VLVSGLVLLLGIVTLGAAVRFRRHDRLGPVERVALPISASLIVLFGLVGVIVSFKMATPTAPPHARASPFATNITQEALAAIAALLVGAVQISRARRSRPYSKIYWTLPMMYLSAMAAFVISGLLLGK